MLLTNNVTLNDEISTLFKGTNFKTEEFYEFLSNYIIDNYDKVKIDKFIKENLSEFLDRKEEIYEKVEFYFNRKERLKKIINHYFEFHDHMNIEGFIAFRLKDYNETLNQVMEDIYDDFIIEAEYENFIYLIKELIQTGIPVTETMHVVIDKTGKYKIFNNEKREITKICMNEFKEEIEFGIINYDDFLISTLINYCPEKLVIHNVQNISNKEIKNTIEKVFEENIIYCAHCELCQAEDKG